MIRFRQCLFVTLLALLSLASGELSNDFYVRDASEIRDEENWDSKVHYLPGVFEFARGVDYTTGKRRNIPIFKLTYEQSMSGNPEFLYDDNLQGITYRIPDQLASSNWASECSTIGDLDSSKSSSVTEYLKARGSSRGSGFEFSVDVSIKVPLEAVTAPIKTKIGAALGYAKSRGSVEYYKRMRSGKKEVIHVESTASMWTLAWRRYHPATWERMPSSSEFSVDFAMTVRSLAATCAKNGPDAEGRIKGRKKTLSRTACDIEAAELVTDFGTHYNKEARFGGKSYTNFYYNAETASSTQASYSQSYSEHKFSLLFFKRSRSSAQMERKFDEEHMSDVVIRGEMFVVGGDSTFDSPAEWCKSVRYQPTIIRNTMLVPIADLIEDDRSRFAVMMAIMDAWVCNGGTAVNFDTSTGTVQCDCPFGEEYCPDEHCLPKAKAGCDVRGKLVVGFTRRYKHIYGNLYTPIPPRGYELIGAVLTRGGNASTSRVAVLHSSTDLRVAAKAEGFKKVYFIAVYSFGSPKAQSVTFVFRPVCPPGYSSVSDFVRSGDSAPIEKSPPPRRPCIVDACLHDCFYVPPKNGNVSTVHQQNGGLFRVTGGIGRYGSDAEYDVGFFRASAHPSGHPPEAWLFRCIKPQCVWEI